MLRSRYFYMLLVLMGATSYGFLSSLIKMAFTDGLDLNQVTAGQVTLGVILLWMLVLATPKAWGNPFRRSSIRLAAVGIFGVALTTVVYNMALSKLDASLCIVLLFQFTWMTIALDCLVSRRLPRRNELIAIALVLIGTLLAVQLWEIDSTKISIAGVFLGLLSGFTYSLFIFLTGKIKTDLHSFMKSAIMLTAALPFIYLLYPITVLFQDNSSTALGWALILGLMGSAIPTVFLNVGIPRVGSAMASMLSSVELPAALIAAFFLLGERVTFLQWVGMGFILAGILYVEKKVVTN
jgi:drug/metabolite transporter (DMT)-like permease